MELAEDRLPSSLTQEGDWSDREAEGVELVGELQSKTAAHFHDRQTVRGTGR